MAEKFDFDAAHKALQSGQAITYSYSFGLHFRAIRCASAICS